MRRTARKLPTRSGNSCSNAFIAPASFGYGTASVEALCRIAADRGLPVDMHCDETDDPMSRHIETLAAQTIRFGLQGRVSGSPGPSAGRRPTIAAKPVRLRNCSDDPALWYSFQAFAGMVHAVDTHSELPPISMHAAPYGLLRCEC